MFRTLDLNPCHIFPGLLKTQNAYSWHKKPSSLRWPISPADLLPPCLSDSFHLSSPPLTTLWSHCTPFHGTHHSIPTAGTLYVLFPLHRMFFATLADPSWSWRKCHLHKVAFLKCPSVSTLLYFFPGTYYHLKLPCIFISFFGLVYCPSLFARK